MRHRIPFVFMYLLAPLLVWGQVQVLTTDRDSNLLRTVDPLNGGTFRSVPITLSGSTILGSSGLAQDPTTAALYALLKVSGPAVRILATVNPATGVASEIGPVNDGNNLVFGDIAFSADGTLFGVTSEESPSQPETLFTINKVTGRPSFAAALSHGNSGDSIGFNPVDGKLYHASGMDTVLFERLDPLSLATLPTSIPLSRDTLTESSGLSHFAGSYFLWASSLGRIYLIDTRGAARYLADLDHSPAGIVVMRSSSACPPRQAMYATARFEGPAFLYSVDPAGGKADLVGPLGFDNITAIDFANDGVLYAAGTRSDDSGVRVLLTIDLCTGAGTEVAPTGTALREMAIRPSDGAIFAYSGSTLVTVNRFTGEVTSVGDSGIFADDFGLSFSDTGSPLYFLNIFDAIGTLYSVDPATGVSSTLMTPLSLPVNTTSMQAMDVDPANHKIYGLIGDVTNSIHLATVDPISGAITDVAMTDPGLRELAVATGSTPANFLLTVLKGGSGIGSVSSTPSGIACGDGCNAAFPAGAAITLHAEPAPGSLFSGWSGACSGTGDCRVTMSAARTVTANFAVGEALNITFTGGGGGTVIVEPGGHLCNVDCTLGFEANTVVTISAIAFSGNLFSAFGGDCSGVTPCTLTMNAPRNVSANFLPPHLLTVNIGPIGGGAVSDGLGLSCTINSCSNSYLNGFVLTLTATPDALHNFGGWSGACSGTGTCTVTMDADRTVSASFSPKLFALTVARSGNGTGTVSGDGGINCGSVCSAMFAAGTAVSFAATAAQGSIFTGWSGDCTGKTSCVLAMLGTRNIVANFRLRRDANHFRGDFDGDGKADRAVWRPTGGTWFTIQSQDSSVRSQQWGGIVSGVQDVPVPGDYDGDGKTDISVWRPTSGVWFIRSSSAPGAVVTQQWGATLGGVQDVPVPGDYDGDGKTDIAVWRPVDGGWYVRPSAAPGTSTFQQWGGIIAGVHDIPVPADYDGDGKTDIAVWRPSAGVWFIRPSATPGTVMSQQWGATLGGVQDVPVAADYDGDNKADVAVWRPSDGVWYIRTSATPGIKTQQWGGIIGGSQDIPVPADFDGDGKADIAVWRPVNGYWFVRPSTMPGAFVTTQWGAPTDLPAERTK